MAQVCFLTDPHLGLKRSGNTSSKSQEILRTHLYEKTLTLVRQAKQEGARVYILGDLFDRHSNPEYVILQGLQVVKAADRVLAGNHDQLNIAGAVSSLGVLCEALRDENIDDTKVVINDTPSEPFWCHDFVPLGDGKVLAVTMIPHCFTQDLFAASINGAIKSIGEVPNVAQNLLCLHCNIGENFGKNEIEGSTLTLTDELQQLVCENFEMTLIGHDHHPKVFHDGKIVVLGNIFPVGFGEIEDRFMYWYDTDTCELDAERIFVAAEAYAEITVETLLAEKGDIETICHMVDVVGSIKTSEYPDLSRALLQFWRVNEGTLFAVRNRVQIDRSGEVGKHSAPVTVARSLSEIVAEEVLATDFAAEFTELTQEEN